MFTVENIMDLFLTPTVIENMGNWYPRVLAVMSCVIPFTYLCFTLFTVLLLLYGLWRIVTK